jgi:hypothetical protein
MDVFNIFIFILGYVIDYAVIYLTIKLLNKSKTFTGSFRFLFS